jgi:hypothetical protein
MRYAMEIGSGTVDVHTEFHKDWLRHSKVNGGGGGHRNADIMGIA